MNRLLIPICAVLFLSSGCANWNGDKTLIAAQIAERTGNDTFDAFVHLDRANEVWLKANAPEIHKYANVIRRNGDAWVNSAIAASKAYAANRTPQGKANLDTALAVLNAAIAQSTQYIAVINARVTTP